MSEVKKLPNIIHQCMTIGAIPTSYKISLTYEEQLMWFCKFLEDEVIPVVNNNSQVVEELKEWFENLDVQEEIDNKLEEMADSGELAEIIAQYLELQGILAYNTLDDLTHAENIDNGSFAKTYGNLSFNDGFGAYYKIREITNSDVVDGFNLVAMATDPSLVAERIHENDYMYTGINIEHKYDSDAHCHYHVTKIPHVDNRGNKIIANLGTAEDNITTYGVAERPLDFAKRKQAELVINAGCFNTENNVPQGMLIQNGQVIKSTGTSQTAVEYLGIDSNGVFKSYPYNVTAETMLDDDIQSAVCGWFAIVKSGVFVPHDDAVVGGASKAPRQVIAQDEELNTYIFTCEGRTKVDYGMTIEQVANILIDDYNCIFAFNLDGGGSTSTVIYNEKINYEIDDDFTGDRAVPTFLYFKKTNEISELKNQMFEQNILNGGISDFFKDLIIPTTLKLGNYKYCLTELTDCNEENLRNGLYYCRTGADNSPGDNWYLIFHYTWVSDIINDINLRQIAIPTNENMPILWRLKYSTGPWTGWRQMFGNQLPKGATANRPETFLQAGAMYLDTTLNKLLVYDGTQWRDTMGNIV